MITRQQLALKSTMFNRGKNSCEYITIHETGNKTKGANAAAHANLQSKGNVRQASWHYTVDQKEAVQSFLDEVRCWHAGSTEGNNKSIGIEICVNNDGDFILASDNAARLTAALINKHKLSIAKVVQHNHWSGKNCPENLRAGKLINWDWFLDKVAYYLGSKGQYDPKPNGEIADFVLRFGNKGPEVAKLQTWLNRVFPTYANTARSLNAVGVAKVLDIDGSFGAHTKAWVEEFQERTGLVVDGIFGPATQAKAKQYGWSQ